VSYRITVVCLGNICRSPIAEAVLCDRILRAGLEHEVIVDSAGTGDWHLGHPADPRALTTLETHDYRLDHRARQIDPSWLSGIDLILAMDMANFQDLQVMQRQARSASEIRMLRAFDPALAGRHEPSTELEVPDPYEGGDAEFVRVLHMIESAADGLIEHLGRTLVRDGGPTVTHMSTPSNPHEPGPQESNTAPPGWYAAPDGTRQQRYWSGNSWGEALRPASPTGLVLWAPDGSPVSPKSRLVVLLLAIFLGAFGVHSFYVGKVGVGLGQLAITILTCGIFGWIWPLVDVILVAVGTYRDSDGRLVLNWES